MLNAGLQEAAHDLGWPVGTVKGRLSRARDLLRRRLSRRGVSLSAAALTTALATSGLRAAVPTLLMKSTVSGAAAAAATPVSPHVLTLSKGVIHAMFWSKCAVIAKVLALVTLIGTGAGYSFYCLSAAENNDPPPARAESKATQAQPDAKSEAKPAPPVFTPADRATSMNNLKHLALAMHNYHSQYGQFPPAAVFSKDGKALLSWRVLLLPFLDEEKLFNEFKLDQPWDSAHNKKLLPRMPAMYAAPKIKTRTPHATFYQVFTGKGTIFQGMRSARITDITDGTSNTIMLIEAGEPVSWSKPADLAYDSKKALPRLGGIFPDGFYFACADGAARFCKSRFREQALRDMITSNGGEIVQGSPDE